MNPCIAPANPDDNGKPINFKPCQMLRPISSEDNEAARRQRELLIEHTRKTLNIFTDDSED